MPIEKRTISLPAEQAAYMDRMVASGAFASASEVVRAGLRALKEREDAIERWLKRDVAEAYDAVVSERHRVLDAETIKKAIDERHRERLKDA